MLRKAFNNGRALRPTSVAAPFLLPSSTGAIMQRSLLLGSGSFVRSRPMPILIENRWLTTAAEKEDKIESKDDSARRKVDVNKILKPTFKKLNKAPSSLILPDSKTGFFSARAFSEDIQVIKGVSLDVKEWPIWKGEPSTNRWNFKETEVARIFQGHMTLISQTGVTTVAGPGDFVVFPKGISCKAIIHQEEHLLKHYTEDPVEIAKLQNIIANQSSQPSFER